MEREETMAINQPESLKLSVMRGLVEEVTENLAGVYASIEGARIFLFAYFFEEPTEDDREHIEMAATLVIADYPAPFSIETHFDLISNAPRKGIPWFFLRAEAHDPRKRRCHFMKSD